MPASARVWIYQAGAMLNETQQGVIAERATAFCEQWSAHSQPLKASFKILHNRFLILAVDESFNTASGCSIDSSVHFIQSLEKELGVSFFDRTQIAFLIDDQVYVAPLSKLPQEINQGRITPQTPAFNLQAQNLQDLQAKWLIPAGQTWMKRYFNA